MNATSTVYRSLRRGIKLNQVKAPDLPAATRLDLRTRVQTAEDAIAHGDYRQAVNSITIPLPPDEVA